MRIKAKAKGSTLKCKVQVKHIMLPYDAAKKKGVDANFITYLVAKVGDRIIYELSSSQFISKNPIFKFQAKADGLKKGDKLEITWRDLSGKTVTKRKKIKGL